MLSAAGEKAAEERGEGRSLERRERGTGREGGGEKGERRRGRREEEGETGERERKRKKESEGRDKGARGAR